MHTIFILLVIIIAALAAILIAVKASIAKKGGGNDDQLYQKRAQPLFSAAERSFLGVLDQATAGSFRVFGKVRIADLIEPRKNLDRGTWQRAFNRISAKHFDFVLCNLGDLSAACVIELDDSSHQKQARRERDAFVAGLCESSALPLLRVQARADYSITGLRLEIEKALALAEPPSVALSASTT